MTLSTHVLDTGSGLPAADVPVVLSRREGDTWQSVGHGVTDADGRCRVPSPGGLVAGDHRLDFDTGAYFAASRRAGFYPEVSVVFRVTDPGRHHHVPLLLSAYSYSTYLGS